MSNTTFINNLTTGSPGKELRTTKLPATGRIRERSKGERIFQSDQPSKILLSETVAGRGTCSRAPRVGFCLTLGKDLSEETHADKVLGS